LKKNISLICHLVLFLFLRDMIKLKSTMAIQYICMIKHFNISKPINKRDLFA
jgi:hypothetical protein